MVSAESFASADAYDIVASNIETVNGLFAEHLRSEEVPQDALRSYYVDYYLAQVNNGGFSQFVWNSKWPPEVVNLVREGLCLMKAEQHLQLFEENVALVDRMGPAGLAAYLRSDYWGDNAERDALGANDRRFFELANTEDLIALNAAWLRGLPTLQVQSSQDIKAEIERRAAALPDRQERQRQALENEPRYLKLMRALSLRAGQAFVRATAGDPTHRYNGEQVLAWHFLTDKGHHYMVDAGGKAIMFDGATGKPVAEIAAP